MARELTPKADDAGRSRVVVEALFRSGHWTSRARHCSLKKSTTAYWKDGSQGVEWWSPSQAAKRAFGKTSRSRPIDCLEREEEMSHG